MRPRYLIVAGVLIGLVVGGTAGATSDTSPRGVFVQRAGPFDVKAPFGLPVVDIGVIEMPTLDDAYLVFGKVNIRNAGRGLARVHCALINEQGDIQPELDSGWLNVKHGATETLILETVVGPGLTPIVLFSCSSDQQGLLATGDHAILSAVAFQS